MPNTTSNFSFNLPLVNDATDEDLWGTQLNENWTSIDSELLIAQKNTILAKDTAYTTVAGDENKMITADATSGAFTVTVMPSATAGTGFIQHFKKIDSSTLAVTVDYNGSETGDGASTFTLGTQYDTLSVVSDGTNWVILNKNVAATTAQSGNVELATTAETQTGTDTGRAITPAGLQAAIGFSNYAQSSEFTVVSAGTGSFTHGLGAVPNLVTGHFICKSAENGYAVNDEVYAGLVNVSSSANDEFGVVLTADATTVDYTFANSSQPAYIINKSTGGRVQLTDGSWKLVIRAWA
jgi:hypothetical protein